MKIKKTEMISFFFHFLLTTIGSLIYAMGISFFVNPHSIAPGGATGIAIVISRIVPLSPGMLVLLMNVPLFVIAFFRFRFRFAFLTVYTTVISACFMDYLSKTFETHIPITDSRLLAAIVGGALIALGVGFVFHGNACTGGTDVIVKLLRQKYKHFRSGVLFGAIDTAIVVASATVLGIESALYACVCIAICAFVLNYVLYSADGAKVVLIVSKSPEIIANRVLGELGVGVTYLEGQGGYSHEKRKMLLCIFRKRLYKRIRDIVSFEDPSAFMVVGSVQEVFGEGFKDQFAEEK